MAQQVDKVNHISRSSGDEVMELVHAVMHQFRSRQFQVLRDGPHALTHMESKVLAFFARRPGATQSDLVQHSKRDKAQLARLIKGLRERGLLAGEADKDDKRHVQLNLTVDGEALQRALQRQARQLQERATVGFSAVEREKLLTLLARVKDNLDAVSD
jgi:DNA-binding MarR family transcriptional regulator